jgi:squalene synthase HpnC
MPETSLLEAPELSAERIEARAAGENFPVISLLSPRWARPHLRAIYGFARLVDNLGDEAAGDREALLGELERELHGPARTEIMRKVHATVEACALSKEPFARLIEANRIDQVKSRYETWEEVRDYCTYSADPVGRLVLGVYGRSGQAELLSMSDSICTGLQLVNFVQDPPRDLALGRVYLPQEDLRLFGVGDADMAGPLNEPVAALLRFEGERARSLLEAGLPLAKALGGRAGMSVALYARGGLAALDALEKAGWDVFSGRPAPTRWTFARLALRELVRR